MWLRDGTWLPPDPNCSPGSQPVGATAGISPQERGETPRCNTTGPTRRDLTPQGKRRKVAPAASAEYDRGGTTPPCGVDSGIGSGLEAQAARVGISPADLAQLLENDRISAISTVSAVSAISAISADSSVDPDSYWPQHPQQPQHVYYRQHAQHLHHHAAMAPPMLQHRAALSVAASPFEARQQQAQGWGAGCPTSRERCHMEIDSVQMLDAWVGAKRMHSFEAADRIRLELLAHGVDPNVHRPRDWAGWKMEAGRVREAIDRVHDAQTETWLDQWVEAKRNKFFALADRIREDLRQQKGVQADKARPCFLKWGKPVTTSKIERLPARHPDRQDESNMQDRRHESIRSTQIEATWRSMKLPCPTAPCLFYRARHCDLYRRRRGIRDYQPELDDRPRAHQLLTRGCGAY